MADARSDLHQAARDFAAAGIPVFPCAEGGKEPACANGFKDATTDLAQIDQWWTENPRFNIAIEPDRAGWCVVDKDGEVGDASWVKLISEHPKTPETYEVSTPHGRHLYFAGRLAPTASKLAEKVDTRGRNSYVLVAPSVVDGKHYEVSADRELAQLPSWIAELATKRSERASAPPNVELDAPGNIDRAIAFLNTQPPAIEGQGGDAHTFATAAALRDLGVSEEKARELLLEWNDRCVPPWPGDELETKVSNAFAYAQNEPGAYAVGRAEEAFGAVLDKLPLASAVNAIPASAGWHFGTHDPVADASLPPITYRDAHKLWPKSRDGTVTQVIAGPKCHKTNWVLAELFRLMQSASARVLILALEGGYGVRTMRVKALAEHFGVPLSDLNGRFQVAKIDGGLFDLSDAECVVALARYVSGNKWTDVFIDTQHRAAGTLEENSATDARILWNAVEFLRREGRCNVVLAHHTGKDEDRGGRGSSADLASVDQQIKLKFDRATMTVEAKITARKDGVDGFAVPFKVHQPSPNAVPILVSISAVEYDALTAVPDKIAPAAIGAALRDLNSVGRDRAVATHVLARHILHMRDELPSEPEEAEKATTNLQKRILDRVKAGSFKGYAERVGGHKNAGWLWSLPDVEGEGQSDV